MPDQPILPCAPTSERRSPSTGLPILSTEPLTAAEREDLRRYIRILQLVADHIDTAIALNRVSYALQSMQNAMPLSQEATALAARLGSNR